MNWTMSGWKTYLIGAAMIVLGLLREPMDERMLTEGLAFITLRAGVKKMEL